MFPDVLVPMIEERLFNMVVTCFFFGIGWPAFATSFAIISIWPL
jgi:hypothetical protein